MTDAFDNHAIHDSRRFAALPGAGFGTGRDSRHYEDTAVRAGNIMSTRDLLKCYFAIAISIVLTALFTTAIAVAQQDPTSPQIPGVDSTTGQANCSDLFSPCTTGMGRQGTANTYTLPYDPSEQLGNADTTNLDFGERRSLQSTVPIPITGPAADRSPVRTMIESKRVEEPPTEFQLFVAGAIGKMLPLFGSQLFLTVPSTFAPLDKGPVTPDYVIGPGDELLLRAW